MDSQTTRKLRWFWAWEDELEERWLSEMSRSGWHLETLQFPGFYTFRKGEPRHYVYRLDFNSNRKEFQHYVQLFHDAGWQHLMEYGNWQYFRTEARPGETPEIFTDNDSKLQKYRRVMLFLIIFLPQFIIGLSVLGRHWGRSAATPSDAWFYAVVGGLYFGLFLIFICAILNLMRRIQQLKQRPL